MSRVYIGNLTPDCRESDVERLFRGYGRITDIELKGVYGFLNFDSKQDAEDAIREVNGRIMNGERVRVNYANPLPRRSWDEGRRYDGGRRERSYSRERRRRSRSSSGGRRSSSRDRRSVSGGRRRERRMYRSRSRDGERRRESRSRSRGRR